MLPAWWLAMVVLGGSGGPSGAAERVAMVPFFGNGDARGLEAEVARALQDEGLTPVRVTTMPEAATGCEESPLPSSCVEPIVERWRADPSASRVLVLGSQVPAGGGAAVEVRIFDRHDDGAAMKEIHARMHDDDLIMSQVLPGAVAAAIAERLYPPPPITKAELEELATLDDPPRPPPELDDCIVGCCHPAPPPIEYEDLSVDLRRDFAEFCRVTRKPRTRLGEPVDPRPPCIRGPVLGYVRPRTWTTASLLVASAGATGLAFGQRAVGWDTAGIVLGDHRLGASLTTWGTAAAITTGMLAIGTVILALADRRQARRYFLREKQRRWLLEHEE